MATGVASLVSFARREAERCALRLAAPRPRRDLFARDVSVVSTLVKLLEDAVASSAPETCWRIPFELSAPVEEIPPPKSKASSARPKPKQLAEEPELPITGHPSDIAGCRTLLLEVVRRAAYDWVLYRDSSHPAKKALAEDAYEWLFEIDEDSPGSGGDEEDAEGITSFLSICDTLDIAPEVLRARIRVLTRRNVVSIGRPAEYRRRRVETGELAESAASLPGAGAWSAFAAGTGPLGGGGLF
ncbi:hypothetical protein LVJ94_35430 [Pendulispora rubella]|uniref:Uncharacterized protein n=1 Tax=Pendulispora rubella TaxID=2741070 RepID=A0ABZ2KU23_9BACT